MKLKLILSLVMLVIMVATFVLFVFGKLGALPFWIIILVVGVFSYVILPRMKDITE
jgi:hypothetical protein